MLPQHFENAKGTTSLNSFREVVPFAIKGGGTLRGSKGPGTFCFAALCFLFIIPRAFAWEIERYENDAVVHENGITTITETIHVDFGGELHHGIYRDIPVEAKDSLGQRVKTRLQVRQVTDENGRPWRYQFVANGFYLMIRIGDPDRTLSGRQTYQIVYDVERGAIRFFKDHDEFFWNLIGTDWDVIIQKNENRIEIPQAANGIKAVAYYGYYGSTERVQNIQIQGRQISLSTGRPLAPKEGLTVAVAWNRGIIPRPPVSEKIIWWLQDNGIYAMPVLVFLLMLWLWNQKGRDPKTGHSISVEYEPPSGMTPAEAGALIDQKADMQDITATLIDLAVRGYLKIEALKKKVLEKSDYQFTNLKPWKDSALKPHEKEILAGVFKEPGLTVKLSDLNDKFYSKLSGIRSKIYQSLINDKLLDGNPESIRGQYIGLGFLAGILLFFGPRVLISEYNLFTAPLLISAVLSGVMIIIFGVWMPRRTMKGADLMDHVRGFSEFLKRADSDRIKRMNDPTLFERCLPFAMALGFADLWARAFEGIATQPPTWYVGYAGGPNFSPRSFTNDMHRVSSSMGQTFVSVPSSSSSGFSGGGFSGGGGGGGGGGAW